MAYQKLILNNKVVGEVDLERKCYLSFRTDKHFFRIYGFGFGVSKKIIDFLTSAQIEHIIINFDNIRVYHVDMNYFIDTAQIYVNDNDEQLILPLNKWNVVTN